MCNRFPEVNTHAAHRAGRVCTLCPITLGKRESIFTFAGLCGYGFLTMTLYVLYKATVTADTAVNTKYRYARTLLSTLDIFSVKFLPRASFVLID